MATVTYIKPSGIEIEASNNPETKKLAKELGWKKKRQPKPEASPQLDLGGDNA